MRHREQTKRSKQIIVFEKQGAKRSKNRKPVASEKKRANRPKGTRVFEIQQADNRPPGTEMLETRGKPLERGQEYCRSKPLETDGSI